MTTRAILRSILLLLSSPADAGNPVGVAYVSGLGDVTSDGLDDFLVASPALDGTMRLLLFAGSEAGPTVVADWTWQDGGSLGVSAVGVPDADGDGVRDVLLGAPTMPGAGALQLWTDVTEGLALTEVAPATTLALGACLGAALIDAGDIDGDGSSDLLTTAPHGVAGSPGTASGQLHLLQTTPTGPVATQSMTVGGPGEGFGSVIAGGGDVDGDGYADVVVGSLSDQAYLLRGGPDGLSSDRLVPLPGDGVGFGAAVASGGDPNGDGLSDVVVGDASGEVVTIFLGGTDAEVELRARGNPGYAYVEHFGAAVRVGVVVVHGRGRRGGRRTAKPVVGLEPATCANASRIGR